MGRAPMVLNMKSCPAGGSTFGRAKIIASTTDARMAIVLYREK
jgi:hypothetical protein